MVEAEASDGLKRPTVVQPQTRSHKDVFTHNEAKDDLCPRDQGKELAEDGVDASDGRPQGVFIDVELAKDAKPDLSEHEPEAEVGKGAVHGVVEAPAAVVVAKLKAGQRDQSGCRLPGHVPF